MINTDHLTIRVGEFYILNTLDASSPPSTFESLYESLSEECLDALPAKFMAYKSDISSASDFLEIYQESGCKGLILRVTCPSVSQVRFNEKKELLSFSANFYSFYEDVIYVERFEDLEAKVQAYNDSFVKNIVERFKP